MPKTYPELDTTFSERCGGTVELLQLDSLARQDQVADRGMLCKVAKVSGGITNLLLKLSPPDEHKPVLVRVFGDNTDIVIDRKAEEIVSLQIYKAGFGAEVRPYINLLYGLRSSSPSTVRVLRLQCLLQILGTFSNGRVESWIHMRPLEPEEMCEQKNAGCIAQRLAAFHAADIHDIPKEPQVFQRLLTWYSKSLAACMLHCSISGSMLATTLSLRRICCVLMV